MKTIKHLILMAGILFPLTTTAQSIGFEQQDYKSIGVYDTWEHSPFRTGKLQGNVGIIANPHTETDEILGVAPNPSAKVLAFQRSRFASNTFGARIDLQQPLKLTPTLQYVHVMLHKPVAGRVMLIGLGKRVERNDQSKETEQFWVLSTNKVEPDQWVDAVFPIKGAEGVDVHSLVVVPDNESPHMLTEDFAVYIDCIEVNDKATTQTQREDYPLNIDKEAHYSRIDRGLLSILLNGKEATVAGSITKQTPVYSSIDQVDFIAKAGETLQPAFKYNGNWMHGYVYLDYGRDGRFDTNLAADGKPVQGSDVVAYAFYSQNLNDDSQGFNSLGQAISGNDRNVLNPPAFTLPADMQPGFYRMRYKVDWNCIDAGGNISTSNNIINNGGAIVDIRLNVHRDQVRITNAQRNGEVFDVEGNFLNKDVPFGKPVTIKMRPENGFTYKGIRVRHGYNLQGDSLIHGVAQYRDVIVKKSSFDENDSYTLPAELIDGDVVVEGLFVSIGSPEANDFYSIAFDKNQPNKHASRRLNAVRLNQQEVNIDNPKNVYHDLTQHVFVASAGTQVAPGVNYSGSWMQTLVYVDKNKNGYFNWKQPLDGGQLTADNELVSFSAATCNGQPYSSDGQHLQSLDRLNAPKFTLPDNLETGHYMMRYKIDWDNVDPEGNTSAGNHIANNGGAIADVRLFVHHGEQGTVNCSSKNGTVLTLEGQPVDGIKVPYGQSFTVQMKPDKGFKLGSVKVRHGNLAATDSLVNGVAQYVETVLDASACQYGLLDIAPGLVDGDLQLQPSFVKMGKNETDEDDYVMVFNDEFNQADGTFPDSKRWKPSIRYHAAWNRFVSPDPKVAFIKDGCLVLRCFKNPDKTKDPADMLSGAMETRDLFSFKYGRVDVRMKTTRHAGNFPAAWMMPQPPCAGWPNAGEIDIFETINMENKAYHTVHSNWTYNLNQRNNPTSSFSGYVDVDNFHVYSLEWNEEELIWYVDGVEKGRYHKSSNDDDLQKGQWPFNAPFYLILNQSVGNGQWASNPDMDFVYESRVDYVRVFQPKKLTGIDGVISAESAPISKGYYDLQGRKTDHPMKGVYIHDGKKIVIK